MPFQRPRTRRPLQDDLLRFATAGSVDDGKCTLIGRLLYDTKQVLDDQLERVATRRRAAATGRRRARPRAAHRRPAGRARAGHHDRRRLPLLRDRAAQVHHRRHARPRAVHAQHGHRAPRPPTWRSSWSTRATASSSSRAATRSSPRCWASRTSSSCVNKMDLVGSTQAGLRRDRRASSPTSPRSSRSTTSRSSRSRRCTATTSSTARAMPWYGGPAAALPPRARAHRLRSQPDRRALPGPVGDPPRRSRRRPDYRGYAGQLAGGVLRAGRRGRRGFPAGARGSPRSTASTARSTRPSRRCR